LLACLPASAVALFKAAAQQQRSACWTLGNTPSGLLLAGACLQNFFLHDVADLNLMLMLRVTLSKTAAGVCVYVGLQLLAARSHASDTVQACDAADLSTCKKV
jgi:hypothetical protein